jgi:hypothetical protein
MKLDMDLFPVGKVELMDKKILVHMDQAETTKGKNVAVFHELHNQMIKPHNPDIGVWKEIMLWKPNINGSWRKTGGTGLPEASNGTDSSKPRTSRISEDHDIQGNPGGGRCNTLLIGNPGKIPGFPIGQVRVTWIAVLTVLMCCAMEKNCHKGWNRLRSTS